MSLSELRKELKDLRKKSMPTPVSRMKKHDVATEIERLRSLHSKEVTAVSDVLAKEEVPKTTAKKVKAVQEVAHKAQEEVVKKTKGVKAPKEEKSKEEKPKTESKKGSEEMKERMKKLREMRKKKD
jgi:hypothetical protein